MQGNTTEIDERNLLRLDALLSHGYGLSPQLVMRSKGLSIEAKALYGYLSSFAGAGDTAFPSTSRILEELDISKNRFYKIRKELVSWGFISIETTATSAGLRTVYTLPQNPIAIKTEIDEIANRRNEIKSSLVANLHNEDMVSHKGDSESECLQQSAGNEPCRQSEAKAQNRGSNLKPCLQSEDEGCLQSGDKLYIDTNINPKVSIDRSAAHPSDDEGPSDWKVTEGMTDPTQRDDGESDRDANRRDALDAVPDGTYDPLPTVADGYTLSNSEFEAFNHLCSLSIKTVRVALATALPASRSGLREISPRNTISPIAPSSMGRAGRNVSIPTAVLRMTRSCAVRMMHPVAREPSSVSRYSPSRSRAVPSWPESSPRTIRLSRKTPIRVAISQHRRCSRSTSTTHQGSMGTR